jgi:hypothetical protein
VFSRTERTTITRSNWTAAATGVRQVPPTSRWPSRRNAARRERLEKSYSQVLEDEAREQQRKTIQQAADEFLTDYRTKHASAPFADYALRHLKSILGLKLVVEITPAVVKGYQSARLKEKAGPKTINDEVQLLLRVCGEQGASDSRGLAAR